VRHVHLGADDGGGRLQAAHRPRLGDFDAEAQMLCRIGRSRSRQLCVNAGTSTR
jgi:hypothetical protein